MEDRSLWAGRVGLKTWPNEGLERGLPRPLARRGKRGQAAAFSRLLPPEGPKAKVTRHRRKKGGEAILEKQDGSHDCDHGYERKGSALSSFLFQGIGDSCLTLDAGIMGEFLPR